MTTNIKKRPTHHKKRRGEHQKRTSHFHKVYLPYLPAVLILLSSIIFSGYHPTHGTLAYATDMNSDGLLAATNFQREANGQKPLTLNPVLSTAAAAKAKDMTVRNYWSHNTPDGKEPWSFMQASGYQYTKAGENLAYGFLSPSQTITGWMNSASHRSNMLDVDFTEVGFGYANANNFNKSGPETVVVAMYGKPAAEGAVQGTSNFSPTKAIEPTSTPVTRLQILGGAQNQWLGFMVGLVSGAVIIAMLIKHGLGLRHLIKGSREFAFHHPVFDATAISILILCVSLSRTIGFIR